MKTSMRERAVSMALLAGSMIILLVVNGFSAGPSFISSGKIMSETTLDTIPQTNQRTEKQELLDEIEEIDWEKIKAGIEDARQEAMEQINVIDWDEIKNDIKNSSVFNDSVRIEIDH
jgi:hypothetical protein